MFEIEFFNGEKNLQESLQIDSQMSAYGMVAFAGEHGKANGHHFYRVVKNGTPVMEISQISDILR